MRPVRGKTWGWYGKADYVFKSVPGIPSFVQQVMQVGNRRGQSQAQKALGFMTGVRAEPLDPPAALMEVLFKERDSLATKLGALGQRAKAIDAYKRALDAAEQESVKDEIRRELRFLTQ